MGTTACVPHQCLLCICVYTHVYIYIYKHVLIIVFVEMCTHMYIYMLACFFMLWYIIQERERQTERGRRRDRERERDREIEPNNQKHYRREQEDSHNGTQKDIGKDNINKETNNMNTQEKERERETARKRSSAIGPRNEERSAILCWDTTIWPNYACVHEHRKERHPSQILRTPLNHGPGLAGNGALWKICCTDLYTNIYIAPNAWDSSPKTPQP